MMMQQKEIFKKVGSIIMEITEQYQYLSENPERQNGLELELFSANADFLAEHIKVLKKFVNISATPAALPLAVAPPASVQDYTPSSIAMPLDVKEVTQPVSESELFQNSAQVSANENPVAEAVFFEEVQPEVHKMPVDTISVAIPVTEMGVKTESERIEPYVQEADAVLPVGDAVPPSIVPADAESVTVPLRTLNDIISEQKKAAVQEALSANASPIADLKTAINLNDKLLFIKDLFNGYSLAYSEAIDLLNRFDSMGAAEAFLNSNYAAKNNWDAKQSTVTKFYDILKRRYVR